MSQAKAQRVNIYTTVTRFQVWLVPLGSDHSVFVALSCQGHSQPCSKGTDLFAGARGIAAELLPGSRAQGKGWLKLQGNIPASALHSPSARSLGKGDMRY